jgi:hypothetical protein
MSDGPGEAVNYLRKAVEAAHDDPEAAFEALSEEFSDRAEQCDEQLEAMDEGGDDDYKKGRLDAFRSAAFAARVCQFARQHAAAHDRQDEREGGDRDG